MNERAVSTTAALVGALLWFFACGGEVTLENATALSAAALAIGLQGWLRPAWARGACAGLALAATAFLSDAWASDVLTATAAAAAVTVWAGSMLRPRHGPALRWSPYAMMAMLATSLAASIVLMPSLLLASDHVGVQDPATPAGAVVRLLGSVLLLSVAVLSVFGLVHVRPRIEFAASRPRVGDAAAPPTARHP